MQAFYTGLPVRCGIPPLNIDIRWLVNFSSSPRRVDLCTYVVFIAPSSCYESLCWQDGQKMPEREWWV
jgi:hypothetical protein